MVQELERSNVQELLLWLMRLRRRFRVTGASMSPLLRPGDEVLVDPRAYRRSLPKPGDIVVAQHPFQAKTKMIKRVRVITEDGRCFLTGDNPEESSDSRSMGSLLPKQIIGRVTSRFA